ncbi:hypothetical protein PFMG_01748 [Plasmodium falciparum IGH-CR14]|uniref:Uncharacterized protein n=1 Tax=Plasmodium falciparum IGH-CR14 TaxID=580059 RepID=A0A0L1I768_PLAFA|nr:hypothetical protein PFMG_01748 [Plasmodium falciparum IGH-CR14]
MDYEGKLKCTQNIDMKMTENPEFHDKIWTLNFVMTCSDVVSIILCANKLVEKMDQNFEEKLAERAIPPPIKNFKNGSIFTMGNVGCLVNIGPFYYIVSDEKSRF